MPKTESADQLDIFTSEVPSCERCGFRVFADTKRVRRRACPLTLESEGVEVIVWLCLRCYHARQIQAQE